MAARKMRSIFFSSRKMCYICSRQEKRIAMLVANPIYDIVFKYLMEDERIARTLLTALLKKEVTAVEVRPHEYTNVSRDSLSIFRIDFGATVREADGSSHLVLIELQKTWVETETLRFRQYLGVQYASPKNIIAESREGNAIPMVAIYILGHKVGDIEEPVLYVRHHPYSYDGELVTKGLPDPFVDSLTHDSIIVQIPRLRGKVNNRLDFVLSIFDQSHVTKETQQILAIDASAYSGDADMMHIVHRLVAAAADAEMRYSMNVEDEYYSIIEKRDTDIMLKDKKIAEQNTAIKAKEAQIEEQNSAIKAKEAQIEEQNSAIKAKEAQIEEQQAAIEEQQAAIEEQQAAIEEKDAAIEKQLSQLKKSIGMLLRAGMSPEGIALQLGVDLKIVKEVERDL